MKRQFAAAEVVILACTRTLSGCPTVKSVGEYVQSGGRAVERVIGKIIVVFVRSMRSQQQAKCFTY